MALAEIVSVVVGIVPTISISLGVIDIDIDLGVHATHASTRKPTSTSSSTQTITPTSATHISVTPTESVTPTKSVTPTESVTPTSVAPTSIVPISATHTTSAITTTSAGFVSTTTRPTSRGRTTFAGSPTVPIPTFTNSTTASPKISEISTGVSSSLSTGSIELASSGVPPEGARVVFSLTMSLDGVPLAAAEGLPIGALTSENGSVVRTVTGSGTTWFTTIAGASSTANIGGTSTSNPQHHQGRASLSPGIIAAIVIALLFILFSFLFFFCCQKKTRRDQDTLVGGRSFGVDAFRRNIRSGLALPVHVRSRNPQRKSIRLPTSPTSPTFLITPMAEARHSIPSVISDGSRTQYDARDSISSNGSTTDSHRSSFESIRHTSTSPTGYEESSAFLKPEMLRLDNDSRFSGSSVQYLRVPENVDEFGSAFPRPAKQVVYVPNSAFRLTTVPIPPIPPLPSSPPPLPPPSPHTSKSHLGILNPFDPPSPLRLNRSFSTVDVRDPFQDSMDS